MEQTKRRWGRITALALVVLVAYLLLVPARWAFRVKEAAARGVVVERPIHPSSKSYIEKPAAWLGYNFRPYYEYCRIVHERVNGQPLYGSWDLLQEYDRPR